MKEFLSQKGLKYTEHDVANDAGARREMLEKTGRLAVPTLTVGQKVVVGFNPGELEKLLH